jgi:hypothetical protein
MAAAANLVLVDYAGVNVTYYPQRVITGDQATYVDRTNGVLAAQSKASVFYKETTSTRKVTGKVTFPVLNATTGVLSHTCIGSFEMVNPLVASMTDRQNVRRRLSALVAHAVVTAGNDDGEMPW